MSASGDPGGARQNDRGGGNTSRPLSFPAVLAIAHLHGIRNAVDSTCEHQGIAHCLSGLADGKRTMIEMHIQGVTTDRKTQLQIAWLEGVKGSVMFPVVVGGLEALSISSTIHRHPLKRPNAHDLMESILDHFNARVERVEITEISQGLLRANVVLEADGASRELSARASDAVALAAKYQAPIYLSERVLARVGYAVSESDRERLLNSGSLQDSDEELPGGVIRAPREVSDEDMAGRLAYLEERLGDAVKEERYEDAAAIRSEIDRISPEGSRGNL